MSKLRQLLRLHSQGESKLNISKLTNLSRNTVKKYIKFYLDKGLTVESIEAINDEKLDKLFGIDAGIEQPDRAKTLMTLLPEYAKRLKKRNVTRESLWKEYIAEFPEGYRIAQFKRHISKWLKFSNPTMHINHKVGDKMFIDFTGEKLNVINKNTGEIIPHEVFVCVLGSSQYTYFEAVESQRVADFIQACENALRFYGGVPKAIVPDNLKSAVIKGDRYEPTLNQAFEDFASHYNTAILPARPYKPKDKSLVEGAVKITYRRVFDKINEKEHYTLKELNNALWAELKPYNDVILTGKPYSRQHLFDEIERQELHPLPERTYELRRKQSSTVSANGHVCLRDDKNYYSVPYKFIGSHVQLFYSNSQIDIYHRYTLIATHIRNRTPYFYTSDNDHMASTHRFVSEWNPERYIGWAEQIDKEYVAAYIKKVLDSKMHPEQAYKSSQGILSFERKYGRERLINACKRGIEFGLYGYSAIKKILANNYDTVIESEQLGVIPEHNNIRGEDYYK